MTVIGFGMEDDWPGYVSQGSARVPDQPVVCSVSRPQKNSKRRRIHSFQSHPHESHMEYVDCCRNWGRGKEQQGDEQSVHRRHYAKGADFVLRWWLHPSTPKAYLRLFQGVAYQTKHVATGIAAMLLNQAVEDEWRKKVKRQKHVLICCVFPACLCCFLTFL